MNNYYSWNTHDLLNDDVSYYKNKKTRDPDIWWRLQMIKKIFKGTNFKGFWGFFTKSSIKVGQFHITGVSYLLTSNNK